MVILSVCEKTEVVEGRCYVETKSLDGETNLKMRRALKATKASITGANDIGGVGVGTVEMEHPNKLIDSFKGNFQLLGMEKEVIDPNNVLLRGCTLRNVDWAICIIVNTGLDTKIMMSNSESPVKQSSLEMRINQVKGGMGRRAIRPARRAKGKEAGKMRKPIGANRPPSSTHARVWPFVHTLDRPDSQRLLFTPPPCSHM